MNIRIKNALINILLFLLFYFICTGVVYILFSLSHFKRVDIMGIWWNLSVVGVLLVLLVVVFMCIESKRKEKSAYCHYNKFNCKLMHQIKTNVWRWVYSSFLKILQIFSRFEVSPQVKNPDNTTDNHSFHKATLTQEQPNANKTIDTSSWQTPIIHDIYNQFIILSTINLKYLVLFIYICTLHYSVISR